MKKNIRNIIPLMVAIILVACTGSIEDKPVQIHRMADFPVSLSSPRAFVVDGQVYMWSGRDEKGKYRNEIWAYDSEHDQWNEVTTTPFSERVRATVCVVEDDVYMGLGFNGQFLIDSAYRQDWWRYSPKTEQWTRLADYPSQQSLGTTPFYDGTYIYLAYGYRNVDKRDVFRYDIAKNQWTHLEDHIRSDNAYPTTAQGACGASAGGRFFVGTGNDWNSKTFWAEMVPEGEEVRWIRCAEVPGRGRACATACGLGNNIYLAGGRHWGGTVTNGEVFADVLCYDADADRWTRAGELPNGPRENMTAWTVNGKVYFGLGNDQYNRPCNQIYCIEP